MKCPHCQCENRKDAKFCLMCGERLGTLCPYCDAPLPAEARFCDQCGRGIEYSDTPLSPKHPAPGEFAEAPQRLETKVEHGEIFPPPIKQRGDDGSGPKLTQKGEGRTPAKAGSGMGIGLRSVPLYIYRDQWRPKTRFCLFLTIFYVIAMLFLILAYLYPENRLVRTANIFPIFWANFVFICFIFLLVAWCVYGILDFCYTALMRSKWFKPKLGEVLLDEGFVTEQELEEALAEQQMKLGEILLQQGSITQAQLKETLEEQSRAYKRLGVILRERGYVTDKDIQRALAQSSRRLGQILEEKGFVRGYELHLGLGRQRFGIRTLRWD